MVKICSYEYPKEREEEYKKYYENYPYKLHDFQKWAVEGIVTGNHVLIAAPTGSGKTFGGDFSLEYFHSKGKRTIYTSPIKALSNEKFYNFTHKYPHISIGLITGDIKTNPDADVLIMTTEILLNKLYQIKSKNQTPQSAISFEMDMETELGCVVFDEIHFIGDENRGHVWEQSIMMLPSHVQMVGLSATLDNPEKFARWLETKGDYGKTVEKEVYLTRKQVRAVPLIHYNFLATSTTVNKVIKDKVLQEEIRNITNKPIVIQDANGKFDDISYNNMTKVLKLFEKNDIRMKRQHVLNKVSEYLVQNEMLPALCYVFSRKQLEICAEELTTNLLEFDSKVPYIVDRECEQIIRKLPNYQEYLHLPEYLNTVKLLRKGVGIHHAGLLPVLREITEMLFAKGFIKILFCTETMSVGINLPVKTTIFTDINKFNGEIIRTLYSHEYTQAAGRAGRLGLDKVGHVIHLNNLFRNVDSVSYKKMMNGKPQSLTSKFKISYNLLLNLLDVGDSNLVDFAKKSMITDDIKSQTDEMTKKILVLESDIIRMRECVKHLKTPQHIVEEYMDLQSKKVNSVNKKRREIERNIETLVDTYKNIESDKNSYASIIQKEKELVELETTRNTTNSYIDSGVERVLDLLQTDGFVTKDANNISLTFLGQLASQLRETHCLVFAKIMESNALNNFSCEELITLFSCFTNISVPDEVKDAFPKSENENVNEMVKKINDMYIEYQQKELRYNINTGTNNDIQYDLMNYVIEWSKSETIDECKWILQKMESEKQIFLGEFVKALLKINNISCEMEKLAELTNNMELLSKLREISKKTLKYVVTNQSLYV
jgi:superfamily II RNA helicase